MKNILLASALVLMPFAVSAEVVEKDWKVAGDGKSILDTYTGFEWLKLTETQGLSANDILADSRFDGWQFASAQQIVTLFNSVAGGEQDYFSESESNINWGFNHYGNNYERIDDFVQMMGQTNYSTKYDGNFKKYSSIGYIRGGLTAWAIFEDNYYNNGSLHRPQADLRVNFGSGVTDEQSSSTSGWFMFNTGGVTYSSINDPSINIGTRDVPVGIWGLPLLFSFLMFRRKRS